MSDQNQLLDPSTYFSGHAIACDSGIAKHFGHNAAHVLNHIIFWLKHNYCKDINFIEEKTWMFESQEDIANFLEMSPDEVNRAIKSLEKAGILIRGNFNKNKFDRTSWYTLYDQEKIRIKKSNSMSRKCGMEDAQMRNGRRDSATSLYKDKHTDKHTEEEELLPLLEKNETKENSPAPEKEEVKRIIAKCEKEQLPFSPGYILRICKKYPMPVVRRALYNFNASEDKKKTHSAEKWLNVALKRELEAIKLLQEKEE